MLMKSLEKHTLVDMKTRLATDMIVETRQPFLDWVAARVVSTINWLTYKPWPRISGRVWLRLDELDERRHSRHCNNNCGIAYARLPTDAPTGPFPFDKAHEVRMCTRMPVQARWDCWVYDVTRRNLVEGTAFAGKARPLSSDG